MQDSYISASAPDRQPARRRRRTWTLLVLVLALVLALVIGTIAIGAYFFLDAQQARTWSWQDPLWAVDASRVRPDLAVLALLDEPHSAIVAEALAAGEPDTGYALLVHSTQLADAERSGQLLRLGKAFQAASASDLAALAYQQMHALAALSPELSDFQRAESSLSAADGFIALGLTDSALPSLEQAEALARYSPLLAPVNRQEIAVQLAEVYRTLGMEGRADDLLQLAREPAGLPDAGLVRGPFLPGFRGQFVKSAQLVEAENERLRQAALFLDAWDTGDSQEIEAARSKLAGALLQEDGVREAVTAASMEASPQLSAKAAVVKEQIDWLGLKYFIASGAMGFRLVPEWELDRDNIAASLGQAYDLLFALYNDQAAALPNASDIDFAQVEVTRLQNMLGRLGLYTSYSEGPLAASLEQAQQDISDRLALLIITEPWGNGIIFRLAESFP